MSEAVKFREKAPGDDVFRLIPVTEEKRLLKKIEQNTTKWERDEVDVALSRYGEKKLSLLIQIDELIELSNKKASEANKKLKNAGFVGIQPKQADLNDTLH